VFMSGKWNLFDINIEYLIVMQVSRCRNTLFSDLFIRKMVLLMPKQNFLTSLISQNITMNTSAYFFS